MSQLDSDIKLYEKTLDMFYDAVTWNKSAEICVDKLLSGGETSQCRVSDEEDNPYSEEPLLPPPTPRGTPAAHHPSTVITIDADKQREILKPFWKSDNVDSRPPPRCQAEEWLLFSPEERRALHQHTLQHTLAPATPPDLLLQQPEQSGENLTDMELMKRQRDLKRRRQAYRSTATGSKSLTEVTREMIDNIMEMIGAKQDTSIPMRDSSNNEEHEPGTQIRSSEQIDQRRHKSHKKEIDRKKKDMRGSDKTEHSHFPTATHVTSSSKSHSSHRSDRHKHHKRSPDSDWEHRSNHKSHSKKKRRDNSNDSKTHKG